MGDLRTFDIDGLVKKFNLLAFVETGTFQGDTVEFCREKFLSVDSIEIDEFLVEQARVRFKDYPRVKIWSGSSSVVLRSVLDGHSLNTLFWLDAHFPGADKGASPYTAEANLDTRLPLEKELAIVKDHCRRCRDVVVIDDLRVYEDGPFEGGTIEDHFRNHVPPLTRRDLVGDKNSDFIYEIFKELDYECSKDYRHQGYLIFQPKL